ncbi:MAG TPA: hypothetical protein VKA85_07430 [Candidatus Limnocylindrales bacterium]|nr:hypothetical protein [Candidatus Limnocylindrales bacterium]
MDWPTVVVQWLHIFLAIFWFGGTLYSDFVIVPALSTLSIPTQREVGSAIGARATKVIPGVAGGVILLGILRGTVFGNIKSVADLGSPYGITWVVALILAIATFMWGLRVITPAIERLNELGDAAATRPDGKPSAQVVAAIDDLKRKIALELVGFVLILVTMVLMRFGA